MQAIAEKLIRKYGADVLIVYGSYADGSNNAGSDFDALLLADVPEMLHDVSVLDGIQLDVFIYPSDAFQSSFDPEEIIQIHDGLILRDCCEKGASLKNAVNAYLAQRPKKTMDENLVQLAWCRKMLTRTLREDPEGFYRWHWLLCDSLEICFDLLGLPYFGPKKALRTLKQQEPVGYLTYTAALQNFDHTHLAAWISYLESKLPSENASV